MISSNRNRKSFPWGTTFIGLLLLIILIVVGIWRTQAAGIFYLVAEPMLKIRSVFQQGEVTQLRAQVATLEAKVADRDVLYAENIDLKRRLGRDTHINTILAAVLMRPPGVPYDTYIIDAGLRQGVAVGDLVSAGGTTLIGSVTESYDSTSKVTLFSAPGASYQGIIAGKIPISVEGQGGGSLKGEVPVGTHVVIGDPILFPGIAGGLTAQVSYVDHESESFQTVYMHIAANPFELLYVEVWKGPITAHE
ncbi:hypothetical protein KW798_02870 [Candidatus Parcubacteria bacterium]|nr:hypothetical protein [Candidatus Parcubacteria bacterium]